MFDCIGYLAETCTASNIAKLSNKLWLCLMNEFKDDSAKWNLMLKLRSMHSIQHTTAYSQTIFDSKIKFGNVWTFKYHAELFIN